MNLFLFNPIINFIFILNNTILLFQYYNMEKKINFLRKNPMKEISNSNFTNLKIQFRFIFKKKYRNKILKMKLYY